MAPVSFLRLVGRLLWVDAGYWIWLAVSVTSLIRHRQGRIGRKVRREPP